MYYIKSNIGSLPADKQRKSLNRIVCGVKVHSKTGGFVVSEQALLDNYDEVMGLVGGGEIHLLDERGEKATEKLKELKAAQPEIPELEPAAEESTPEPDPEPTPEPEPTPDPEPDEDEEEEDEEEEDEAYTKEEVEAMTKDELLDLAGTLGIQDEVNYKDLKGVILKKVLSALKL